MADITQHVKRFEEWLNDETSAMSDPEYVDFLEEIEDHVSAALRAKKEELEED